MVGTYNAYAKLYLKIPDIMYKFFKKQYVPIPKLENFLDRVRHPCLKDVSPEILFCGRVIYTIDPKSSIAFSR